MGKHTSNGDTHHLRNGTSNGTGVDELIPPRLVNRVFDSEELKIGRRILRARTQGQQNYIDTIDMSIVTLCSGCAGTGKTYIATAKALEWLKKGIVNKVLLCRPAVECGKGLGFVPGELEDKFSLHTRPFRRALNDYFDKKELAELVKENIIEIQPPDYLRGDTFDKTAMILDEAQNCTIEQLRMFLTRIGEDSRMIITGDISQCDLDPRRGEGFRDILNIFSTPPHVDGINIARLTKEDIVRSNILQKIIEKIGE